MEVPEGVNAEDVCKDKNVVCVLNKAMYGLKQAPRYWNNKIKEFLRKFDFKETEADKCIFVGKYKEHTILLATFVDNGLIVCKSRAILELILKEMSREFDITVSDVSLFVGLQISRNRERKSMFINQSTYAKSILRKFNMSDAKPVSVPADPNTILKPVELDSKCVNNIPYREAVGSLTFLAIVTRPDIAFAVNNLSKALNRHNRSHSQAVKRVLAYIVGSLDVGIEYLCGGSEAELISYSDADYASDLETLRSTTGYVFCMANGPVTWSRHRQKLVTLSTTKSEYVAAATAAKELIWLRKLLKDIGG